MGSDRLLHLQGQAAAAAQLGAGGWRLGGCARRNVGGLVYWRPASPAMPVALSNACCGRRDMLPSSSLPLASACSAAAKHSEGGAGEPSWGEVLSSRAARIGVMLFLFQQFSGINAIVYFSSSGTPAAQCCSAEGLGGCAQQAEGQLGLGRALIVRSLWQGSREGSRQDCTAGLRVVLLVPFAPLAVFEKAGIQSGALASAAVGATNVLGTVVAAGLMDKAGRK